METRNASKCSVLRPASSTIHRASATTLPTTPRPHGDTPGILWCRSRPVSAIQRATVATPILVQASVNPCKTLQTVSICFKMPCRKLQYFALKCSEMLHFVSFTPVHPPTDIRRVGGRGRLVSYLDVS